ncbi:hypothetical protein [Candidatus Liberibacter sp.]|uniref:hypothetical protein n=1 Tax=Candidatus Liberibacter sp. TaxID=34022 RepID=UPI0015F35582|nr:hypothetical protein [Candidatus Liberibacter sp.]MBA5724504.1 hypothetical protein [Candidatus Liberibacter sp.]
MAIGYGYAGSDVREGIEISEEQGKVRRFEVPVPGFFRISSCCTILWCILHIGYWRFFLYNLGVGAIKASKLCKCIRTLYLD